MAKADSSVAETESGTNVGHSHDPMKPSAVMKHLLHCVEAQRAHAATTLRNLWQIYVAKEAPATQTLGIVWPLLLGNFSVEQ